MVNLIWIVLAGLYYQSSENNCFVKSTLETMKESNTNLLTTIRRTIALKVLSLFEHALYFGYNTV